jgi:hypothetical protein
MAGPKDPFEAGASPEGPFGPAENPLTPTVVTARSLALIQTDASFSAETCRRESLRTDSIEYLLNLR